MPTAIKVTELHKTYGKGKNAFEAVKGISLEIMEGELFGFLGPNGAGKTTSLKMMVGLLDPTDGTAEILGMDPRRSKQDLKRQIGIIPQDISIYEELTVLENLRFMAKAYKVPKEDYEPRITALVAQIGLVEKQNTRAKALSGGQKRRLNLIMGLVHDPKIVLCDEPTPGLDPQSRVVVWDFLNDLCKKEGKTVVLTTHFMEEADRLSDRVAIIDHGQILVVDQPFKLKSSVGEGDLLELDIDDHDRFEEALNAVEDGQFEGMEEIVVRSNRLLVRCQNVVPKISDILNQIEEKGINIVNMSLRSTTLEDVFISLTGRSLRD